MFGETAKCHLIMNIFKCKYRHVSFYTVLLVQYFDEPWDEVGMVLVLAVMGWGQLRYSWRWMGLTIYIPVQLSFGDKEYGDAWGNACSYALTVWM